MKYLKTYRIFESSEFDIISDNIKDMLHDITDSGLYVEYIPRASKSEIIVSSYEIDGENQSDDPTPLFNWSDISPTIRRIESYLNEFDYHVHWSVYVSGVLSMFSSKVVLDNLDKINPSAIDFTIEIELFTHEEWKKLWDSH